MPRYLVQSPHTPDDCLRALEEVLARGPEALARYEWGCMAGDHTGYAMVEAGSKSDVEATVPRFLQPRARVVELNTFSPEQIRSFRDGL